jgi:replication fork protection complex subunit Tof1/Swi1
MKTYMTYLSGYRDFRSDDQVKRVVNLMHRQAVKAKSEALFFKVPSFRPLQKPGACFV